MLFRSTYADLAKLAAAKRHIATRTDMEKGRAIPCQTRGFPGAMLDSATLIDFAFTPGRVTVTDTSGWARRILTDGRAHLNLVDQFQGDSIGHWEGQTLVVDTESLDANNELFVGFYIGANAHVVERYTLTDANTLSDDITIDAPDIFKEPYKTTMKFRRHADWQINEYDCYFNNRNNDHKIIR